MKKKAFKPGKNPPVSTEGMVTGVHSVGGVTKREIYRRTAAMQKAGFTNPYDQVMRLAGLGVVDEENGQFVPAGYTRADIANRLTGNGEEPSQPSGREEGNNGQYNHCFLIGVQDGTSKFAISGMKTEVSKKTSDAPRVFVNDSTNLVFGVEDDDPEQIVPFIHFIFSLSEPLEEHRDDIIAWLHALATKYEIGIEQIIQHDEYLEYDDNVHVAKSSLIGSSMAGFEYE